MVLLRSHSRTESLASSPPCCLSWRPVLGSLLSGWQVSQPPERPPEGTDCAVGPVQGQGPRALWKQVCSA